MASIRTFVSKIPYASRLHAILRQNYREWRLLKRQHRMQKEDYFNIAEIKRRQGPVVLVSRPIAYTFPLSYAYLAAYLKSKGVEVEIVYKQGSHQEIARRVKSLNPILVGFGNLYPELEEIRSIIAELNSLGRDYPIVIGGQMVSPIPECAVSVTGADFGVIGEGEIILYQLVREIQGGGDFSGIGGLAIRHQNSVELTGPGEYIENLSDLPPIPYELFHIEEWLPIGRWYTKNIPEQPHWRFNDRVINVHGGRGCPFRCNFCYHHNKPRYRDIDVMMDEAERALDRFDGNMLYFSDDLVIATPKRVRELLARLKKINRPISYSVSTRFDILERLEDELLAELKATGCRIMGLGIESGSDRILKIIGKNTTASRILAQLQRLKENRILPTVSIMVGQDSETREDVMRSMELMKQSVATNPLIQYAFTIATPFPGSPLYEKIFSQKMLADDQAFYMRYFSSKTGDWNQVVNLSAMSDNEVISLRGELEETYNVEKGKAYGPEKEAQIKLVCDEQKALAEAYDAISVEERDKTAKQYEEQQLELETQKLTLMGIAS
jgi:anaerobic magnesium-protoporphyrin IX monomethyl ester cyclase